MILPIVFIALLLCAEARAGGQLIADCEHWACFTSKRCLRIAKDALQLINEDSPVNDDCSAIMMIRPYSKTRWEVVLESWKASETEISVSHDADSNKLFSCKKTGSESEATSSLPGFEKLPRTSTKPLSCQFFVGDETNAVVRDINKKIKMIVGSTTSDIGNRDFLLDVEKKLMCDPSKVQFESTSSPDEVTKKPDVQLETVVCSDAQFKLQYKSDSAYVDVDTIVCEKDSDEKYKYKIGDAFKDGPFHARCHAKVCSFCSYLPTTASGTPPSLGEADGCKTLTCAKFFKIGADITEDKATCVKGDDEKFTWMVGTRKVEESTAVECVDTKPCKKVTTCSGACRLDSASMPSCASKKQELSTTINSKPVANITVACDGNRGQLTYAVNGKAAGDLPDDAGFTCAEITVEEKVATGGGSAFPGPLQICVAIAAVLSLLLIGLSAGLWYWRKRKNEAKAAEAGKSKPDNKTGE